MKPHPLQHHLRVLRDAGAQLPDLVADPLGGHVHVRGCSDTPPTAVDYLTDAANPRSLLYGMDRGLNCLGCAAQLADEPVTLAAFRWVRRLDEVVALTETYTDLANKFLNGNDLRRFAFPVTDDLVDAMETYAETNAQLTPDVVAYTTPLRDRFLSGNPHESLLGEYVLEAIDDLTLQWKRLKANRPVHAYALRGKPSRPQPQVRVVTAWADQDDRISYGYTAGGLAEGLQAEAPVLAHCDGWLVIEWDARLVDQTENDTAPAGNYTTAELEQATHLWLQDPDGAPFATLLAAVHAAYA